MVIILLGPPGVGKGTQGIILADEFGWVRLATGDLLRDARRGGTELGAKAQVFMDAGELVPDDLVIELVREHLDKLGPETTVIFDGFPRTLPQAEALAAVLESLGREVDRVIVLNAPDEILIKRISGRRMSPGGRVYNVYFSPPKVEGICDETGEALIHRKDDLAETVANRLQVYRAQTAPLIQYYEEGPSPVSEVDGAGDFDDVQHRVRDALALN